MAERFHLLHHRNLLQESSRENDREPSQKKLQRLPTRYSEVMQTAPKAREGNHSTEPRFLPPVPVLGDINETNLLHHALGIGIGFLLTLVIIIQTIRYSTDMNPLSPRSNSIGYDDRTCRTFSAVQPPQKRSSLGVVPSGQISEKQQQRQRQSMEMSLPSWRCAMFHWLIPLQKIKYLKPLQKHCIGDCLACEQNCWSCPFPHPTSSCPWCMRSCFCIRPKFPGKNQFELKHEKGHWTLCMHVYALYTESPFLVSFLLRLSSSCVIDDSRMGGLWRRVTVEKRLVSERPLELHSFEAIGFVLGNEGSTQVPMMYRLRPPVQKLAARKAWDERTRWSITKLEVASWLLLPNCGEVCGHSLISCPPKSYKRLGEQSYQSKELESKGSESFSMSKELDIL